MTFESVVFITFTWIVVIYFYYKFRWPIFIKTVKNVPGPKVFPIIGNALYFARRYPEDIMDILLKLAKEYSSPFQIWISNKLYIGIDEPDQIKVILQHCNCLDKGNLNEFVEGVFGKASLLMSPAYIWIKHRKILASSFNSKMLRNFFDIFVENSLIFMDKLEKIGLNGNEIELSESLLQCTVSIACDTAIGVKWDLRSNKIDQYCKAITRCRKIVSHRFMNILLYPNIIFKRTSLGREYQKCLNIKSSFVDEMIQQRKDALNKSETDKNKITHRAICDVLLKKSNKEIFTQEHIHDNVFTMLAAATDTNTIAMDFVIFMLANFPKMQEKAYQELLGIYGMKNSKFAPIKYEDLQSMDYLDRVIKETMRLFPAVPLITRQLTEDLRLGEIILPKDANIVISLRNVHRNEKYWPNPLMFDPDRFLPERLGNSYLDYYIPFSKGPRNCIGMKYAMISMKVILATLIRTFVFKVDKSIPIDKIKLKFEVLLSPAQPLKVKIERRNFLS